MTVIERPLVQGSLSHGVEREFHREGVILVLAHLAHSGEPSVCLLRHKQNLHKGIRDGDLGLPSETIEPSDSTEVDDAAYNALHRLFTEELGVRDPLRCGLYRTPYSTNEGFTHSFNLQTGLNGPSSDALGYGLVMWVKNPVTIISSFRTGQSKGLVDPHELSGVVFVPVSEILQTDTPRSFRTAPHAPTIIRQVMDAGMLRHP